MDKKKYLIRILYSFILAIIVTLAICILTINFRKSAYSESYQSVIRDKYELLVNTESPKIVIVGGSNACFGIDNKMLSEKTGYPVVNLALHAGFGALFNTEISKANIMPGDIVLVAYEYGWPEPSYFDDFGVDLIMTGIGNEYDIYKYVPINKYPALIGYIPEYAKGKANYRPETGTYSRESFDEDANCIFYRDSEEKMLDYDPITWVGIDLTDVKISDESVKHITEYKEYVESRGASIYMIGCPIYDRAIINEYAEFDNLVNEEESRIGIDYISNPLEYIFGYDYIFDTMYHCNSMGQQKRTELLINDMLKAGII